LLWLWLRRRFGSRSGSGSGFGFAPPVALAIAMSLGGGAGSTHDIRHEEDDMTDDHRAGRREWIALAVLALPGLLITLDFSVLTLAVPKVSADLLPSGTELLWIVDIYGFTLAGFLVTMGTLGDRIGGRRLLMFGAAAFGAASIAAAYSTSAPMLIVARAVLGVAGATLLPSTLSLIRKMFPDPAQRTVAIAVWSTSLPIGGAVGPLVGGVMLEWFWWGAAFLLGVPVMALLLVTGPLLLPEHRDAEAARPDLASVALSLAAVLSMIYGLTEVAAVGAATLPIITMAAGAALGAVFVVRQLRLAHPLIDVRLFHRPAFSAALGINALSYFVILGILMLIAQYMQLVLGLSPLRAGLWTVPAMGGLIIGSLLTPLLARRASPASAMAGGLLVAAIGFGVLTQSHGLPGVVTGSLIVCLGLAPVTTLVVNLVLGSAPPENSGAASGLSETSTEFGGALGIAILGTVATAVYRDHVSGRIPVGVPADQARAARNTLGGAVDTAGHLPPHLANSLLDAARAAFSTGMTTAAAISAAIMLAMAIISVTLLRNVPLDATPVDDAQVV
jgi:MFS transporter, DHA2 family, multidrug resistance protein